MSQRMKLTCALLLFALIAAFWLAPPLWDSWQLARRKAASPYYSRPPAGAFLTEGLPAANVPYDKLTDIERMSTPGFAFAYEEKFGPRMDGSEDRFWDPEVQSVYASQGMDGVQKIMAAWSRQWFAEFRRRASAGERWQNTSQQDWEQLARSRPVARNSIAEVKAMEKQRLAAMKPGGEIGYYTFYGGTAFGYSSEPHDGAEALRFEEVLERIGQTWEEYQAEGQPEDDQ